MILYEHRKISAFERNLVRFISVVGLVAIFGLMSPMVFADESESGIVGRSAEAYEIEQQIKQEYLQQALAPGEDIPLGGTREPDVAVDPNNPLNVAVASLFRMWVSTDGGNTFSGPTQPPVNAGQVRCGDPSIGYDSQGRLFWTYLGCTLDTAGNTIGIDLYISQVDPTTGAIMAGYPVNITQQLGIGAGAGNSHDKQWLAIDVYPGSPFTDRLYVVWTDLTGQSTIWNTWSSDQGQTWNARVQLSGGGEGFVWPSHNTVAPNGDYYAAYHSQPNFSGSAPDGTSGRVWALRSTDGGATFPQKNNPFDAGEADITFNVQSASNPIANTQFWLQGSAQPWILADPNTAGRMYCFAADDPDDDHSTGDHSNVYMVVSTDNGMNWGDPVRIDDGPGTSFQVMPTAAIDVNSGRLVAMYYDNRSGNTNAAGNFLLDVFMTYSEDGGNTWMNDFSINDRQFDPDPGAPTRFNGPPPTMRIGEYNGLATIGCDAFAAWCGNTLDLNSNPNGQQIIFDKVRFDTMPPMITCPADIEVANNPGVCGAVVDFTVTASDDCQDTLAIVADPPSGSLFDEGTTVVTVIATNTIDLSDTCTFTVTVNDTTDPVITCPDDLTFECDNIGPFGFPTATDNCDPDPTISLINRDSIPGACEQEYQLLLTYEAEDFSGNTDQCDQSIMVIDTTPPEIVCPDPDSLGVAFLTPSTAQIEFEVTATDNCSDDLMPMCDSASGSVFEIGDHTISCGVDDGCGNVDSCEFSFHLLYLDLLPTSCPNPLHVKSGSRMEGRTDMATGQPNEVDPAAIQGDNSGPVIPVAILGTDILDVTDLVVESITLNGVSPVHHAYEDVAGPASDVDEYCGCTTAGPDGFRDLTLKFDRDEIVASLGPVMDGELVQVIITGQHTDGDPFFGGDCFLIRKNGPIASESSEDKDEPETELVGATPNPFNPTTTVSFYLSESGKYDLTIYNIRGQVVEQIEGYGDAGLVEVVWNASRHASGVYFYRLSALDYSDTKKMVLVK